MHTETFVLIGCTVAGICELVKVYTVTFVLIGCTVAGICELVKVSFPQLIGPAVSA